MEKFNDWLNDISKDEVSNTYNTKNDEDMFYLKKISSTNSSTNRIINIKKQLENNKGISFSKQQINNEKIDKDIRIKNLIRYLKIHKESSDINSYCENILDEVSQILFLRKEGEKSILPTILYNKRRKKKKEALTNYVNNVVAKKDLTKSQLQFILKCIEIDCDASILTKITYEGVPVKYMAKQIKDYYIKD